MLSKETLSTIFWSLVLLNLGLNPGLPDHWWILYPLGNGLVQYIYLYSYICVCVCVCVYVFVCVCVCVCVFGQHFFINAYFIKQYRHVLSTYFCICPFRLQNWFYSMWRKLVNETPITNCYPSTFCPILDHHQECVYCKSDVTFACTLLLC